MRLTLTVYDTDTGQTVHEDSWHVPNDLAGLLARPTTGDHPAWAPGEHDLRLPPGVLPDRLWSRWRMVGCTCLSCGLPARVTPEGRPS